MIGYIKLHRQILHWEWYTDINTKTLFLHCLLISKSQINTWRGMVNKDRNVCLKFKKIVS